MQPEEKEKQIVSLILDESKKIQDVLNNHFLTEFAKLHNIKPQYNGFYAKQEVIAKKGYFLPVKKKYALWIINNDGVPCDEYDIKGLVTKRSDYPELTRKRIYDLIGLLVKTDKVSFKKIKEFIAKIEDELRLATMDGNRDIARPVSFSKDLANYKKIPSHIHGMMLWNELEYSYFVPGTKGYQYKIKGIDMFRAPEEVKNKLRNRSLPNNIVIPYEEECIPDYYVVDIASMVEFAWVNRVKEMLEPIWSNIDKTKKVEQLAAITF